MHGSIQPTQSYHTSAGNRSAAACVWVPAATSHDEDPAGIHAIDVPSAGNDRLAREPVVAATAVSAQPLNFAHMSAEVHAATAIVVAARGPQRRPP